MTAVGAFSGHLKSLFGMSSVRSWRPAAICASGRIMERVRKIEAVCQANGVPLAAAALQFPLGHPAVASVIPGAIDADQVRRNVDLFAHPTPHALWSELKREKLLAEQAPVPGG